MKLPLFMRASTHSENRVTLEGISNEKQVKVPIRDLTMSPNVAFPGSLPAFKHRDASAKVTYLRFL